MQRERTTEGDFPGFRAELLHFRQIIRNRAATFSAARAKRPTSLPTAVKLNPREIDLRLRRHCLTMSLRIFLLPGCVWRRLGWRHAPQDGWDCQDDRSLPPGRWGR